MLRLARLLRRTPQQQDIPTGWSTPTMLRQSGYSQPLNSTLNSDIGRHVNEPLSKWVERIATGHTFEARAPDDRIYGGDHGTAKMHAMNELKSMDRRLATWNHFDLAVNVLKTARFYTTGSGAKYGNEYLDGRIVGLLMYSETDKCNEFLPQLAEFQKQHQGDFVVVGVSCCSDEAEKTMWRHGFMHLSHRDGATWVQRDVNFKLGFVPLPRLYIIEGTKGWVISSSGYTAVKVNPDTCFAEWVRGEAGVNWTDYAKGLFLK